MTQILTKTQFLNLDLDDKCILLEALMTDAYFSGQQDIGFWFPEDYTGEESLLPPTPPEIKKVEDEKFTQLIDKLTTELFRAKDQIVIDSECFK